MRGPEAKRSVPLGRRFHQLFAATISADTADGVLLIVLPLLVLRVSEDPLAVSAVRLSATIPVIVLSIAAGTIVDSLSRRGLMVAACLARVGVLGVATAMIWSGHWTVQLILAIALILATAAVLYDTCAETVTPDLVERGELGRANARIVTSQQAVQGFIAAPLGTAALALFAPLPTAMSAILLLLAALLVVRAIPRGRNPASLTTETTDTGSFWTRMRGGLDYLRTNGPARVLLILSIVLVGLFNLANGIVVFYLAETLAMPEALIGIVMITPAVGGIAGAASAANILRRVGFQRTVTTVFVVEGGACLTVAAMPAIPLGWAVFALLFGGAAIASSWWNVAMTTTKQRLVPRHLLGRYNGVLRTCVQLVSTVAIVAAGFLSRVSGRAPWAVAGLSLLVTIPIMIPALRRVRSTGDDLGSGDSAATDRRTHGRR